MISCVSKNIGMTRLRLRLYIPRYYWQEPIISQMISFHNVTVNITGANLDKNTNNQGYFDLEMWGNTSNINNCINYLKSLNIKVMGKANTDGDSWYY